MSTKSLLVLLLVAGCGAFSSADESEPAPPRVEDGGTEAGPDAEADSTPADGGAGDANADSGPEPGCRRLVDEHFVVTPIGAPWTAELNGGGNVAAAADVLRATVTPNAAYGVARIERAFPAPLPQRATLSFSMSVVSHTADAVFLPGCTLQASTTNVTFFSAYPAISMGALRVEASVRNNDVPGEQSANPLGPVQLTKWHAIRYRFEDLSTEGARAIVDVDGVQKIDHTFTFPVDPTDLRVRCGIEYIAPNKQAEVLVDDVVLDVCP